MNGWAIFYIQWKLYGTLGWFLLWYCHQKLMNYRCQLMYGNRFTQTHNTLMDFWTMKYFSFCRFNECNKKNSQSLSVCCSVAVHYFEDWYFVSLMYIFARFICLSSFFHIWVTVCLFVCNELLHCVMLKIVEMFSNCLFMLKHMYRDCTRQMLTSDCSKIRCEWSLEKVTTIRDTVCDLLNDRFNTQMRSFNMLAVVYFLLNAHSCVLNRSFNKSCTRW